MIIAKGRIRSKHKLWLPGDEISGLSSFDEERLIRLGVAAREAPKKAPKKKAPVKVETLVDPETEKGPVEEISQEFPGEIASIADPDVGDTLIVEESKTQKPVPARRKSKSTRKKGKT